MTRRELLERAGSTLLACSAAERSNSVELNSDAATILSRIKPPSFPSRDFDVTKYGAVGDGAKKCTEAISAAVRACSAAGGGGMVIPRGVFLTGAMNLDNNVNLYLSPGATLLFSTDGRDYLPNVFTRFESTECMNYSPFIYAFEKQNIAVTGPGTLDGQAGVEHWWPWAGKARDGWKTGAPNAADDRKLVVQMGDKNLPVEQRVFGEGHYLRPNFVQPIRCKNVLFDGFTVKRSPMWELNPVLCQNVIARNVTLA